MTSAACLMISSRARIKPHEADALQLILLSSLPLLPPRRETVMSAADVLHRLLRLDLSAPESRRVLRDFLHFQGYRYFVSTLESPDVLNFVNFLDKASQWLREVSSLHRKTGYRWCSRLWMRFQLPRNSGGSVWALSARCAVIEPFFQPHICWPTDWPKGGRLPSQPKILMISGTYNTSEGRFASGRCGCHQPSARNRYRR